MGSVEPEQICDWIYCNREVDRVDGWGFAACNGHFIIGQANKDSYGNGISSDEVRAQYLLAKAWLADNPNPLEPS